MSQTREQFNRAKRLGYARIWDGRPYMLIADDTPEWEPVDIVEPHIAMLDYVMFGTKPPR